MIRRPEAAVVIPSYNRPDRLRSCLEALTRLDGPAPEIIVVDDGSETPLAPVCAEFGERVTCIRQCNAGPAAARNAGARAAEAPFVAFTDDDCRARPGWLTALRAAQNGDPKALVGGHVENALAGNVYAAASQSLCDYLYGYFDAAGGASPFFTSNNIGCDRKAFLDLGGFDDTFPLAAAEDRDFGLRWRAAGGALTFAPDAVIDHAHPLTLRRFLRQHANYGRGAHHLHAVMDARGDERPKREALGFYLGLLAHPLRAREAAWPAQTALMGLSQAAMIWGYAAEGRAAGSGPERARGPA